MGAVKAKILEKRATGLDMQLQKNISSETLFEAIENALMTACKNNFGKADNIVAAVDRDTFEYRCYAVKEVVETEDDIEDDLLQISLADAVKIRPDAQVGETVDVDINSQSFGRIATQIAKNVILQKIRPPLGQRGHFYHLMNLPDRCR